MYLNNFKYLIGRMAHSHMDSYRWSRDNLKVSMPLIRIRKRKKMLLFWWKNIINWWWVRYHAKDQAQKPKSLKWRKKVIYLPKQVKTHKYLKRTKIHQPSKINNPKLTKHKMKIKKTHSSEMAEILKYLSPNQIIKKRGISWIRVFDW